MRYLIREFGIFCFGWLGAIAIVFVAEYLTQNENLYVFFLDSTDVLSLYLLAGLVLFGSIQLLQRIAIILLP